MGLRSALSCTPHRPRRDRTVVKRAMGRGSPVSVRLSSLQTSHSDFPGSPCGVPRPQAVTNFCHELGSGQGQVCVWGEL